MKGQGYNKNTIKDMMIEQQLKLSSCEIHEQMCYLSQRLPDLLISIHGEGEFNEDIWNAYYMDGKYQHCYAKITFDDYDVDRLKTL